MSSQFQRLLKQDLSDLEEATQRWRKLSEQAAEAYDDHRMKVSGPLHANWKGDDASAGLYFLENVESRLNTVRTEAMAISTVFEIVVFRMSQARTDLRNAVSNAEDNGYQVDDDGAVTDPTTVGQPRSDWRMNETLNERQTKLNEYSSWIKQALADAEKASDEGTKALSALNGDVLKDREYFDAEAESALDVDHAMKALGLSDPQVSQDDPKAAAEWWKNLEPHEQYQYATLYPELIGKTDGLPSDVRNDANRLALEQELNALRENRIGFYDNPGDQSLNLRQQNLAFLKEELDRRDGGEGRKELYLLDFDAEGDGKAVIAMGNPDTAAHTAIQVPGTDTTLQGSTKGQIDRIGDLQDAARTAGADGEVATIWWLGYDAPEKDLSVTGTGRAEDGAPDLRQFVEGTRAAHQGEPSHLTVLGHSYGSTLVGEAASGEGGLGADNIVAVGSPGMGVHEAADLQMDEDDVWVGVADDDPVVKWVADMTLGRDPSEEDFGGHNFYVDTSGHSDYWKADSASLENQGRIIAGLRPSEVPKRDDEIPRDSYQLR